MKPQPQELVRDYQPPENTLHAIYSLYHLHGKQVWSCRTNVERGLISSAVVVLAFINKLSGFSNYSAIRNPSVIYVVMVGLMPHPIHHSYTTDSEDMIWEIWWVKYWSICLSVPVCLFDCYICQSLRRFGLLQRNYLDRRSLSLFNLYYYAFIPFTLFWLRIFGNPYPLWAYLFKIQDWLLLCDSIFNLTILLRSVKKLNKT
jgi:hypothetical protein